MELSEHFDIPQGLPQPEMVRTVALMSAVDLAKSGDHHYRGRDIRKLAAELEGYILYGGQSPDGYTTIAPECFTNGNVISYKGDNYYLACGEFVQEFDDGVRSTCVKPLQHGGHIHEDMDGNHKVGG